MKETTRLTPPSVTDCGSPTREYALLEKHNRVETRESEADSYTVSVPWPDELGRFTCITRHEPLDEGIPTFSGSIGDYADTSKCLYGKVVLDGKYFDGSDLVSTEIQVGQICSLG